MVSYPRIRFADPTGVWTTYTANETNRTGHNFYSPRDGNPVNCSDQ